MSEVMITVRGDHQVRVAPERAIVTLTVGLDGADHAEVVTRTLALAEPVRASIVAREQGGAVASWSSTRLAVRSERPWTNDGSRPALVHHAAVDFTVTFAALADVSAWVSDVSLWEGVSLTGTDWALTPDTRARVEQEVAAAAVHAAVTRASAYAAALGRAGVTPIEVADAGLIGDGSAPGGAMPAVRALAAPPAASGVELQGEDILVSATVEARFLAG